ncbi:uracil-DNA glycosylase [Palleronia caenipelagi]|uniref:Type-4 uracil-DNA glycosylase n=1 Tax=Palleronia caenipelagi TaxID=2489174 RepID=A0A547Q7R6_9RHOB|nr:uracil-DNA glycosylase [Palleronia caenipelagi]TRD22437.1 uracil-DNA glycosylase [Palleronia caenipelagi]
MEPDLSYEDALAALDWQVELGVLDALSETPIDRFELVAEARAKAQVATPEPGTAEVTGPDPAALAREIAEAAPDLDALRAAMGAFEQCELKRGARNLVFSDGQPGAPVMIVGEAPGRDEDLQGKPFVGRAGQLLDRMFAAIGLSRTEGGLYITNVLPWRPPSNREPTPEEIAMMRPFLMRHIALAQPQVLVIMGNVSASALLGKRGILKLRGHWTGAAGLPALPMTHPAYLLRNPVAKREAWADLLSIRDRLG